MLDELRCDDPSVGEFPRTVAHDGGEAVIEAEPTRVVSIEGTTSLDLLLLMGVTPAAAGGDEEGPAMYDWQAYLAGGTPEEPGFPLIEKRPEVNVEAIAAARPDLVISQSGWLEGIEDQIADLGVPVIVFSWSGDEEPPDWRNNVRIVAEAVGRDACAEEIIASVEAAAVETRAALEAAGTDDDTFAAVTALEGYLAFHGTADPIGITLAEELALELVPADGAQTEFSLERAGEVLAADHVLVLDFQGDGFVERFLEEPTVAPAAERVNVLEPELAGAANYPSTLGLRLFLDDLAGRYGS